MKLIKVVIAVALIGGALTFYGFKPADLLEQGSEVWESFSGDFLAIFNGEAKDEVAKEIRGPAENVVPVVYDPAATAAVEEISEIEQEILRDRKEWVTTTTKVIDLAPEEYKKRLQEIQSRQE